MYCLKCGLRKCCKSVSCSGTAKVEIVIDFAVENSVHWHGYVLRREDGHVFREALDFEVEGHGKKWRPKRTLKGQVEEEGVKGRCTFPIEVECWCKTDCF